MGWVGGYEGSSPSLSPRPSPAVVGSSRCCRGLAGLVQEATKRERPWMPDVLPSSRGSGLRLPSTAFVTPGGAPLASESAGFRRATRGVPPPVASSSSGGCVVRGVRGGSAVVILALLQQLCAALRGGGVCGHPGSGWLSLRLLSLLCPALGVGGVASGVWRAGSPV